jgi:SAM-dependent methyltransferase
MRRFRPLGTVELRDLLGLQREKKILDVGCGGGCFVSDLRRAGYDATGIDPFAQATTHTIKGELGEVAKGWDVIMFNQSLEHIADQVEILALARTKLAPDGIITVRVPIIGYAWSQYGTDWVQLDAPRHLCIHSENSFRLCAAQAGLRITETVYDSVGFQFWGSELVKRGIALEDGRYRLNELFTPRELADYERRAKELNDRQRGDQACFFLVSDTVSAGFGG